VTTPTMVMAAIATSTRLMRARPRQAARSIMPRAAVTITAPRVAAGRYWIGSVRKTSTKAIAAAASSPET
jgi:hypothetical protein